MLLREACFFFKWNVGSIKSEETSTHKNPLVTRGCGEGKREGYCQMVANFSYTKQIGLRGLWYRMEARLTILHCILKILFRR